MSKRESIARYNLIVKKLRRKPSTLSEIKDYLALESEIQGYDFNISSRTFQRDLEDILFLFRIEISYDFSRKVYFIEEESEESTSRILETFDMLNALELTERLSKYVHFEKRRMSGTQYLYDILHAIEKKKQTQFFYKKFWENTGRQRIGNPLALKESEHRWYLMLQEEDSERIKTFALDRMSNLKILNRKFKYPKDFDIKEYFKNAYGIMRPDGLEHVDVILSFQPFQGKYIKTLPLHESQKILADNSEELRIQLHLMITEDFIMKLLSYGKRVTVISPDSLRQQMNNF